MNMTDKLNDHQGKVLIYKQDIQERETYINHNQDTLERLNGDDRYAYLSNGSRLAQMAAKANEMK